MLDRGSYVRLTNGERKILIELCRGRLDTLNVVQAIDATNGRGRRLRRQIGD